MMFETHDDLRAAVQQSRALLSGAVDALCLLIHQATDVEPVRQRVEYVSRIWLLHLCDRFVAEPMDTRGKGSINSRSFMIARPTSRSKRLGTLQRRRARVTVVEPYLKIDFLSEFFAVLRSRRLVRWAPLEQMPINQSEILSRSRRIDLTANTQGHESSQQLLMAIADAAPPELIENYHELVNWADAHADRRTRVLFTANAHQSSVGFRHVAYSQRQLGTTIAVHQHGGGYGIDEHHLGEDHDVEFADVFYSWGWTRAELGGKIRILPTAFPSRATAPARQSLLLMSLPITNDFFRFHSFLVPSQIQNVVAETVAFAGELTDGTDLCVRSSGSDAFPMNRLQGSRANITSDDLREHGCVAASRHRLVIHNYLGTSWLETLAMNIPTVCFYDPVIYRPRAAAQPFVDALAKVGV
ncbi:MAG: hypothetical protein ACKODN_09630, partial [Actinomycetota bacterium]